MRPTILCALMMLGLPTLPGCQQRPLTQTEIQDQRRYVTNCRAQDAPDYSTFIAYCDRF
jgi:hypothetical protein